MGEQSVQRGAIVILYPYFLQKGAMTRYIEGCSCVPSFSAELAHQALKLQLGAHFLERPDLPDRAFSFIC
tara:strand:+ start:94 stop:303 length:210 start_codon:yes stop_codon:yes gene_type:complete